MKEHEYIGENVTLYYEPETHIIRIIYKGILSPAVTKEAYDWLGNVIAPALKGTSPACIFDFRAVTESQSGNILTARKESKNLGENYNTSNAPVALLVENAIQEGMVRVNMKLNPQQHRIRMVSSVEEAMNFFKEFREKQSGQAAPSPDTSQPQSESTESPVVDMGSLVTSRGDDDTTST